MDKIQLLIIDPQNDFCYPGIQNIYPKIDVTNLPNELVKPGALYVGDPTTPDVGAYADMKRLASMVRRLKGKLDDIHVTLDSHHFIDIAHPIFWIDSNGQHPDLYTIITAGDVKNGIWRTFNPQFQDRAMKYVTALEANKRYPLCVWPVHCRIGTFGYAVVQPLSDALLEWENEFAMVNHVTKGSNFWTEHYSAVQADVPDPEDPGTQLNMGLIEILQEADTLLLAGEAKSHCLANTVIDIANNFGEENIKKMVLLEDCTTDVADPPGTTMFSDFSAQFVKDMNDRGMQFSTSVEFLK